MLIVHSLFFQSFFLFLFYNGCILYQEYFLNLLCFIETFCQILYTHLMRLFLPVACSNDLPYDHYVSLFFFAKEVLLHMCNMINSGVQSKYIPVVETFLCWWNSCVWFYVIYPLGNLWSLLLIKFSVLYKKKITSFKEMIVTMYA